LYYNIDPFSVSTVYYPNNDTFTISGPSQVSVDLRGCDSILQDPESTTYMEEQEETGVEVPAGAYCGNYLDIVKVRATVTSLKEIQLIGSVYESTVACNSEAVSFYSSNMVAFPNINSPDDCLGKLLTSFGLDGSSLFAIYDSSTDSVNIQIEEVTMPLTKCNAHQIHFGENDIPLPSVNKAAMGVPITP